MLESDGEIIGDGAGVLAAAEASGAVRGVEAKHGVEDVAIHDDFELFDGLAGGVKCADHATHAGPRDDVDGDMVLFEPLKCADLGESEGSSASEREADAWTVCGAGWDGCEGGGRQI